MLAPTCLIALLLLTGCATGNSEPVTRTVVTRRPVCPRLVDYTAEMQRRAADELEYMPRDDPVGSMIVDYGRLRAALRAACKSGGSA